MGMIGGLIAGSISIVVGVVLAVNVIMPTLKGANTSTWTASETALFSLAGLGVVVGLVISILNVFGVM